MARLWFAPDGTYVVSGGSLRPPTAGADVVVYATEAATELADVQHEDGSAVSPAAPLEVNGFAERPGFWGPPGDVSVAWVSVAGGPVRRVEAAAGPRVDDLVERVAAVEPGGDAAALQVSENLADLDDPEAARTALGLGLAATRGVGTTAGTVAAGDDPRFGAGGGGAVSSVAGRTGAVTLSTTDISGLGTAATRDIGTGGAQVVLGSDGRLSDARTPTAHKTSHATGGTDVLAPSDIGAVPTTRTVTAGTGLTGGGSLAADRTFAVSYGTAAGTAAQGNDSRITGAVQSTQLAAASGVATLDSSTRVVQPASDLSAFGQYSLLGKGSTVVADGATDDATAINAFIAGTPPGATIRAPVRVYGVRGQVRVPGNRTLIGEGWALAGAGGGAVFKQLNGANITATGGSLAGIIVPDKWFTNQTANDDPVAIINIAIDGNKANNPSSTACGIVLCNYWSRVERCYIINVPKHGIHLTDVGQNGTTQIINSASENRIIDNKIHTTGGHGISQVCANTISNQDGFCHHNLVSDCGQSGIYFQRGSGWDFRRNHMYSIGDHGMELQNCFATEVISNEIEDFGGNNVASAYYHGISVTQLNSRGTTIAHNFVGCAEPSTNTSNYQYIVVQAGSSQMDANAVVEGNRIHGPASPTAQGIGIVLQVVSGGGNQLITTCQGNRIQNVNTPYYQGGSVTVSAQNAGITLAGLADVTGASSATAGQVLAATATGGPFAFTSLAVLATDPLGYGIAMNAPLPLVLGASASTHGVANEARYSRVCGGATVSKLRIRVSVASGNVCVAVYNNSGSGLTAVPNARQATSGSIACPAAGDADISLGGSVTVNHGMWFGFNADNTTASFYGWNGPSTTSLMSGSGYTAGSAYPLPSVASGLTANGFRQPTMAGVP